MRVLLTFTLPVLAACSPFLPVEELAPSDGANAQPSFDGGGRRDSPALREERDAGTGSWSDLRGGCFERAVTLGSFPTNGRPHLRVTAVTAFEHGWIVAMSGNEAGQRLLFLDRFGAVIANEEAPIQVKALFVEGSQLIILASYWGSRFDLGPRGVTKRFERSEFLGREGLGPGNRPEGVLATVRIGGGVRVLTHHYDTVASRSRLRLTDLRLDDGSGSGLQQRTGELGVLPDLNPFYADRFVLAEESRGGGFLWVTHRSWTQLTGLHLGLTGLPETIPVRVEHDQLWGTSDSWAASQTLTADHQAVLAAGIDGGVVIRELPTSAASTMPRPLVTGRVLPFPVALHDLGDGRVVVATPDELSFFDRFTGLEVGAPLRLLAWPRPQAIASRPGVAAFVSVEGDRSDQLTLRCVHLPAR